MFTLLCRILNKIVQQQNKQKSNCSLPASALLVTSVNDVTVCCDLRGCWSWCWCFWFMRLEAAEREWTKTQTKRTNLRVSTAAASKNTLTSRSHQSLHAYLQIGPMFVWHTHTHADTRTHAHRHTLYRAASKWLPVWSERSTPKKASLASGRLYFVLSSLRK